MRGAAAAALLAALLGCGRVPEGALRDEQSRSRRYRDAYETQLGENSELRKRLATAEQRARACPAGADAPAAQAPATPSSPSAGPSAQNPPLPPRHALAPVEPPAATPQPLAPAPTQ